VGLGFFDGIHLGHQELLRTLSHMAGLRGLPSCLFTFDRHPAEIVPGRPVPARISGEEDRHRAVARCGIDEMVMQPFDAAFAGMPAETFLEDILSETLQARLIVVGHDYRFGRNRAGTADTLVAFGAARGIEVRVIEPVAIGGVILSSTAIRDFLATGAVDRASEWLGRPFVLEGVVQGGQGLGRRLGFPTANFPVPPGRVLPAFGVYATRTMVRGRSYPSVTNVGMRPTVNPQAYRDPSPASVPLVETRLLDVDLDLYGEPIRVEFLGRIREERRFDGLEALRDQVLLDTASAAAFHGAEERAILLDTVSGIPVVLLRSRRFSASVCEIHFKVPLDRVRAAEYALLTRVLGSCCRRFPRRSDLSAHLDSLYGAELSTDFSRNGDLQQLVFEMDALTRWTGGDSPFREAVGLLFDLLLDPHADETGALPDDMVRAEARGLLSEIAARDNDRTRHAIDRALEALHGSHPHGVPEWGDPAVLPTLDGAALGRALDRLLREAAISIRIAGDPDDETIESVLARVRSFPPAAGGARPDPAILRPRPLPPPAVPVRKRERLALDQARICLLYTGTHAPSTFQAVRALFLDQLLGGSPNSLLFEEVRERLGLAYSVFSSHMRSASTFLLCAGVHPDRVGEALAAIREQVQRIREGRFDLRLLETARAQTESLYETVPDDLRHLLQYEAACLETGRRVPLSMALAMLADVTAGELSDLAASLSETVEYCLLPDPSGTPAEPGTGGEETP